MAESWPHGLSVAGCLLPHAGSRQSREVRRASAATRRRSRGASEPASAAGAAGAGCVRPRGRSGAAGARSRCCGSGCSGSGLGGSRCGSCGSGGRSIALVGRRLRRCGGAAGRALHRRAHLGDRLAGSSCSPRRRRRQDRERAGRARPRTCVRRRADKSPPGLLMKRMNVNRTRDRERGGHHRRMQRRADLHVREPEPPPRRGSQWRAGRPGRRAMPHVSRCRFRGHHLNQLKNDTIRNSDRAAEHQLGSVGELRDIHFASFSFLGGRADPRNNRCDMRQIQLVRCDSSPHRWETACPPGLRRAGEGPACGSLALPFPPATLRRGRRRPGRSTIRLKLPITAA